jgi:UPF0755 protein
VQIDELDLGWEDETDKGRHRRRAAKARASGKKKRRGGKSLLAFFLSIVVLGALVLGGWYGIDKIQGFFSAPDYNTGGHGTVTIQVEDGQTLTDVGNTLQQKGVVKSAKAFVEAAKIDSRATGLQPGFYQLRLQMRAKDALSLLLSPSSRLNEKVTLPEGLTYLETFQKLSDATHIPVDEFKAAAKNPEALGVSDAWFTRSDGKPIDKTSIEGFLFPATYSFDPGVDATTVLKTIIAKFNTEVTALDFMNAAQNSLHLAPYQVLIAASIAQVEGIFPDDMANISRVLYNRAYGGHFPCSCLGLDSTVNYWLKISGKSAKPSQDLLRSEMHDLNNPWNTYDKPGFPIGPISNPGENALKGAATAPHNNYFYFVAVDKAGHCAFATTLDQHNANITLAKRNGVL